jgi:hypothetical protein
MIHTDGEKNFRITITQREREREHKQISSCNKITKLTKKFKFYEVTSALQSPDEMRVEELQI